ncbi:MAG: glycerophosphodiester phosphodiesterase [bacterium]
MKIFAHRGSSTIWPENTLLAFNNADKAGATGFETDLRLSKDGQIVLSHDDTLTRLGHPDKSVSKLTVEEISRIEIASPDRLGRDTMIPLEMLLRAYPGKDYIFDCKTSEKALFEKLSQLLSTLQFHDRIWFLTWSPTADAYVRTLFPGCHYFPRMNRTYLWGWASVLKMGRWFEPRNRILSLPAYHFNLPVFSKRQVASIQRRNKTFVGYLVNSEKAVERCRACGVEILLTDRPDLIAKDG